MDMNRFMHCTDYTLLAATRHIERKETWGGKKILYTRRHARTHANTIFGIWSFYFLDIC